MPEVMVRNRKLSFGAQPVNFDKENVVVILIHGSGGDRFDWSGQLKHKFHHATIIALELPGHGDSEGPGENTVPAYANWVSDFVKASEFNKVVLVGCSLGSAIVLWLTLQRPKWLKGIGLVGSGARLKVHPDFLEGLKTNPALALQNLAEFCLSKKSTDLFPEINQKFSKVKPEVVHGDLGACNLFDVMDQLNTIDVKAFIVVGKEDRLTPVKYSKFLHEVIKGSSLFVIPDAGHLVMLEKPTEFNSILENFLLEI